MARRDVGVGIASADVDHFAFQIKSWRRPDRATGGTIHLRPGRIFLEGFRFLLDCETLPENFSGIGVEGDEAAAELATLIFCVSSRGLLDRRNGYVDPVTIQQRRAGYSGQHMILNLGFPDQFASGGVDRLNV